MRDEPIYGSMQLLDIWRRCKAMDIRRCSISNVYRFDIVERYVDEVHNKTFFLTLQQLSTIDLRCFWGVPWGSIFFPCSIHLQKDLNKRARLAARCSRAPAPASCTTPLPTTAGGLLLRSSRINGLVYGKIFTGHHREKT